MPLKAQSNRNVRSVNHLHSRIGWAGLYLSCNPPRCTFVPDHLYLKFPIIVRDPNFIFTRFCHREIPLNRPCEDSQTFTYFSIPCHWVSRSDSVLPWSPLGAPVGDSIYLLDSPGLPQYSKLPLTLYPSKIHPYILL